MKFVRPVASIGLALIASLSVVSAAAQGPMKALEAGKLPLAKVVIPPVPIIHGSWTRGPGDYQFTVCRSGCDINASPGQSVPLTIEVWGGGGSGV